MKLQRTKKGFTLIELMVVITIIGILATGAVSVYTSQIQKARDSNRVTSIKALQTGIEQLYSDLSEYPSTHTSNDITDVTDCDTGDGYNNISCLVTLEFMPSLPRDPKSGQAGAGAGLDFTYVVGDSTSGVNNQAYEVSLGFEAKGSVASKALNTIDDGNDDARMEIGNDKTLNSTGSGTNISGNAYSSIVNSCIAVDNTNSDDEAVIIKGDCGTNG